MPTLAQKIQDTARRIDRLGQFFAASKPPAHEMSATKDGGELTLLWRGERNERSIQCELKSGRVWEETWRNDYRGGGDPIRLDVQSVPMEPEYALTRLMEFESNLTERVKKVIEREVLDAVVAKRLRRITRPKTRGFKADLKKKKHVKA